jgi:hypothetical protein
VAKFPSRRDIMPLDLSQLFHVVAECDHFNGIATITFYRFVPNLSSLLKIVEQC